jgi:hypothetical protein
LEELVVSRIARKHVSQRLGVLFCFLLPFLEPPQRVRRVLIARLLLEAAHQIRLLVQRSNRRPHCALQNIRVLGFHAVHGECGTDAAPVAQHVSLLILPQRGAARRTCEVGRRSQPVRIRFRVHGRLLGPDLGARSPLSWNVAVRE